MTQAKKTPLFLRPVKYVGRHRKAFFKGLLIAAFIIVSWLPFIVINNPMGYIPGIFVTLGIVLSRLYLHFLKKGLDWAEASRVGECIRGEEVDFVVRLVNKSILLYPRVEVVFYQANAFGEEGNTSSQDILLIPRAKRDFEFAMRFDHLGTYEAGLKRVIIHDLLGLFSVTYENEHIHTVEVLPRLHEIADVDFDSEAPTQSTKAIRTVLNEGMDYAFVREYVWGDPIKSIHWKLSARVEDYLTRIYESNANPGLTTVVDLHTPEVPPEVLMHLYDLVVESALSLNEYARKSGLESILVFRDDCGDEKRFDSRLEHDGMGLLMQVLKKDSSCYEGDANELLIEEMNAPYGQSNLALCTSCLDQTLVETLLVIRSRRKNPILFWAIPQGLEGIERRDYLEPLRRLQEAGIPYYVFSSLNQIKPGEEA